MDSPMPVAIGGILGQSHDGQEPTRSNKVSTEGDESEEDAQSRGSSRKSAKRKSRDNTKRKAGEVWGAASNGDSIPKVNRSSLTAAARDPKDEPHPAKGSLKNTDGGTSPSSIIDFEELSRPTPARGAFSRNDADQDDYGERVKKISGAVKTILECIGEDPDRQGLLKTPTRYAEALLFNTRGYQQNVQSIVNNAIFHEGHNEMVIVKDIEIFSLCEHHLIPFTGKMHIGYIPKASVLGISKLPRIAEMFGRRLQIQERLTKEVANAIMESLKPQGVAVVMESQHLCMVTRGVEKTTTTTITSCVLGCFEKKSKTRSEFFRLIGK